MVSCLIYHNVSLHVCMCVHNNYNVIESYRSSMSGHCEKCNLTSRSPQPMNIVTHTVQHNTDIAFCLFFSVIFAGVSKTVIILQYVPLPPPHTHTHILVVGHAALQPLVDEGDRVLRLQSYVLIHDRTRTQQITFESIIRYRLTWCIPGFKPGFEYAKISL